MFVCFFQRELILITNQIAMQLVNAFLELPHIREAPAGKLSSYSCMSSSTAVSKVMFPFLYFTNTISVRVLDGRAFEF